MSSSAETPRPPTKDQDRSPPDAAAKAEGAAKSLDTLRQVTKPVLEEGAIFDEGAALIALGAVLEAVRLRHGALLAYDGDHQSLALLAHEGLSAQAQAAVRYIRRGMAGVWDMPLHSLLQRRVYIIDRPKENPFVPVLLEGNDQNLLSNLAFIPLYAGGNASGVLLLAGSGARTIREPDILALREHAKILGTALGRQEKSQLAKPGAPVPTAAPEARPAPQKGEPAPTASARDRATLAARVAELEALVDSLWEGGEGGPQTQELENRLADAERERDRLKADLASREFELADLKSQHELRRSRSAEDTERARKLALELAQTREQLAAGLDRAERGQQERDRADRQRVELEGRFQDLERRLGEMTEQARRADTERGSLAARFTKAEGEVAEQRKAVASRDQQIDELRAERERLAASLQTTASRVQESQNAVARVREDAEERIATFQAQVESLDSRLQIAERERDQLRAVSQGREGIQAEIERETAALRAELVREVERRRAAEETYSSVIRDASELHAEVESAQGVRTAAEAQAEEARAESRRLSEELQRVQAGYDRLAESFRAAQEETAENRRRVSESDRERSELGAELERLQGELATGRAREEELRTRELTREEEARKLRVEIAELRQTGDEAGESARTASREREALLARAGALEERIAALQRESEAHRADRERREEEALRLRTTAEERAEEILRLRGEMDSVRGETARVNEALAAHESTRTSEAARRGDLERELSELRLELERSQARGSELTAEIESHLRLEDEFRATSSTIRAELKTEQERRQVEVDERERLAKRLFEMEEVLRGATPEVSAPDLDAASTLRATLERSEASRRSAQESIARLESALEAERVARETARAEADDQRRSAAELAAQVESFTRRLQDAETASASATERAEALAAEHTAAAETAQSLAAELGRRTGELSELSARLESIDRNLAEARSAVQRAQERTQTLEEGARVAASEIASLKGLAEAGEEEKRKLAQELELRLAEARAREERLADELAAASLERDRSLESTRAFDGERRQAAEALRSATARAADGEAAVATARTEVENLSSDLESLRRRTEALEADLRTAKGESDRWQGLNEKLQGVIAEREREIASLRSEAKAAPPAPPAAVAKPAQKPPGVAAAKPPAPATSPKPTAAALRPAVFLRSPGGVDRTVVIFDGTGPSHESLSQLCRQAGFEPKAAENGAAPADPPQLVAINLLSTPVGGLAALHRSRTDETLRESPIVLYASQPGSAKGLLLVNIDCLFRPLEEASFAGSVAAMIGTGKRVTIIGEELESVLKLNGWATSMGCSVSSAGDLKQGSELLDIVKPDLIVLDLPRLGGEGAALIVKMRRSSRLQALPLLLLLPQNGTSPTAGLFLKRLATLAEETPLDLSQLSERLLRSRAA